MLLESRLVDPVCLEKNNSFFPQLEAETLELPLAGARDFCTGSRRLTLSSYYGVITSKC